MAANITSITEIPGGHTTEHTQKLRRYKMKVELTQQEVKTIIGFMERSQIVGKESYVFVQLVTKLIAAMNTEVNSQATEN